MNHPPKSLADALRERAKFLRDYPNYRDFVWGDCDSVIASLYEMADVVSSWSGEYLSKEETYLENQRRRYDPTNPSAQQPMTMEERVAAVKKYNHNFILSDTKSDTH